MDPNIAVVVVSSSAVIVAAIVKFIPFKGTNKDNSNGKYALKEVCDERNENTKEDFNKIDLKLDGIHEKIDEKISGVHTRINSLPSDIVKIIKGVQ